MKQKHSLSSARMEKIGRTHPSRTVYLLFLIREHCSELGTHGPDLGVGIDTKSADSVCKGDGKLMI